MARTVNVELTRLREDSPDARRVFDALLGYQRNQGEIPVAALAKDSGLNRAVVRQVMTTLGDYGLGRLVLGRRGSSTRFVWNEDSKAFREFIPGPRPGEDEGPSPAARLVVKTVGDAKARTTLEWTVKLGGQRSARLLLPPGLTRPDLRLLKEFCDAYASQLPRK